MTKIGNTFPEVLQTLKQTDGIVVALPWEPSVTSGTISKLAQENGYIQDATWDRFESHIESDTFPNNRVKISEKDDNTYRFRVIDGSKINAIELRNL